MTRFSARTEARAVVPAERAEIWKALTDPDLVARLTPFVRSIRAEGDRWYWEMSGLQVAGVGISPAFTEAMSFTELERIDFQHAPPAGTSERAGVHGWYELDEAPGGSEGTTLSTRLEVALDLPLPRLSAPAVTTTMRGVMGQMGERFSRNLLDHLGVRR